MQCAFLDDPRAITSLPVDLTVSFKHPLMPDSNQHVSKQSSPLPPPPRGNCPQLLLTATSCLPACLPAFAAAIQVNSLDATEQPADVYIFPDTANSLPRAQSYCMNWNQLAQASGASDAWQQQEWHAAAAKHALMPHVHTATPPTAVAALLCTLPSHACSTPTHAASMQTEPALDVCNPNPELLPATPTAAGGQLALASSARRHHGSH
jgi:hypothetical protein